MKGEMWNMHIFISVSEGWPCTWMLVCKADKYEQSKETETTLTDCPWLQVKPKQKRGTQHDLELNCGFPLSVWKSESSRRVQNKATLCALDASPSWVSFVPCRTAQRDLRTSGSLNRLAPFAPWPHEWWPSPLGLGPWESFFGRRQDTLRIASSCREKAAGPLVRQRPGSASRAVIAVGGR